MDRIKELEKQSISLKDQVKQGPVAQTLSPREAAAKSLAVPNSPPQGYAALVQNQSFSFAAIARDKYYQVHGDHHTIPKSESYHPRFRIVER